MIDTILNDFIIRTFLETMINIHMSKLLDNELSSIFSS